VSRRLELTMYEHGWYQIKFAHELPDHGISALELDGRPLMAARAGGRVGVFDAVCPHRGAHLAHGGRLDDGAVVCPFHGYRIGLGEGGGHDFCVRELHGGVAGGGVFARLSGRAEPDLGEVLAELERDHVFVPGFSMQVDASMETVIENGFDNAHFKSVHGLAQPDLAVRTGEHGELVAEGVFAIPAIRGAGGGRRTRYLARAFSPGIMLASLEGEPPYNYKILTAATPRAGSVGCTIRLTLVFPGTEPPPDRLVRGILQESRKGLELDRDVWDHLVPDAPQRYTDLDDAVQRFHAYCETFR
jgi:phenylpropionate dioxygenase-like ring-hydroxylating dioxygenase large terminal subunit